MNCLRLRLGGCSASARTPILRAWLPAAYLHPSRAGSLYSCLCVHAPLVGLVLCQGSHDADEDFSGERVSSVKPWFLLAPYIRASIGEHPQIPERVFRATTAKAVQRPSQNYAMPALPYSRE